MRRLFVLLFAAATGYISLSQEMIWMRLISYVSGGEPAVFAHVLGLFLLGVAAGALLGERVCEKRLGAGGESPVRFIGKMLIASALFYYLSLSIVANLMTVSDALGRVAIDGVVVIVSLLLGGIFPVLCHYAARAGQNVGITVSRVYLANIVGSTLGPLLTGFVLMQHLPIDRIILYMSAATAIVGGLAFLFDTSGRTIARPLVSAVIFAGLLLLVHPLLYGHLLEKLQYRQSYTRGSQYKYLIENRSGIISVDSGRPAANGKPAWPDLIYGGGMYDGRFNIFPGNPWYDPTSTDSELHEPTDISNYISKCYMIAGLHPEPTDVLEIGLSSASWTRVMANYIPIQHLTSVEINGGYLQMIQHYPVQASILTDPKVHVDIDDGRRWLSRHPDARFDFILQNTTWHWRSEITNLLSVEYLRLAKAHLKPGGVLYWNTTRSEDVLKTAAAVFPHVVDYKAFVAASDSPFEVTPERLRANLLKFTDTGRPGGKPTFDLSDPVLSRAYHAFVETKLEDLAEQYRARKDLWVITDDNMATEFKRDRREGTGESRTTMYDAGQSWWEFLRRRRG